MGNRVMMLSDFRSKWAHATALESAILRAANVPVPTQSSLNAAHEQLEAVFPCRQAMQAFVDDVAAVRWSAAPQCSFAWPILYAIAADIVRRDQMDPSVPCSAFVGAVQARAFQRFKEQDADPEQISFTLCEMTGAKGWRSIPQSAANFAELRRSVLAGWTGSPRWAERCDGGFAYGIGKSGEEMRNPSGVAILTTTLLTQEHPGIESALSFDGPHPRLSFVNKSARFDRLAFTAKSPTEAREFVRAAALQNWQTESPVDDFSMAFFSEEKTFHLYRPAGVTDAWRECPQNGYRLIGYRDQALVIDGQDTLDADGDGYRERFGQRA